MLETLWDNKRWEKRRKHLRFIVTFFLLRVWTWRTHTHKGVGCCWLAVTSLTVTSGSIACGWWPCAPLPPPSLPLLGLHFLLPSSTECFPPKVVGSEHDSHPSLHLPEKRRGDGGNVFYPFFTVIFVGVASWRKNLFFCSTLAKRRHFWWLKASVFPFLFLLWRRIVNGAVAGQTFWRVAVIKERLAVYEAADWAAGLLSGPRPSEPLRMMFLLIVALLPWSSFRRSWFIP